jgi:iron complex outermembrane receptor protein
VPSQPTRGEFNVNEFYGELRVPILRGLPGADLLQASAAVRSSDYSLFGTDTTTKFGLNWRPLSDLLLRGTYAEGVRAPGIGELFGTFARFDTTIQDPCSQYLTKSPATQANCQTLGVPSTYSQSNPQISVVTGGNPELIPEKSKGYTAGFVYSPGWAQGVPWAESLTFDLTWFKIDIDQTILARDAQVQITGCVDTLDPVLCGGIGRTSAGTINRFNNQLINIGGTSTNGIDFNLRYVLPETSVGRFGVSWQNTKLDTYEDRLQTATGFTTVAREGTEKGDTGAGWPKWKSNLSVDWSLREFSASITARYTDSLVEGCRGLAGLGLCSNYNLTDDNLSTNKMKEITYVDLQASWRPSFFEDNWTVTVGANNILDEDAPFCFSCNPNAFDAATYDVPGVFWYARVVALFGKRE